MTLICFYIAFLVLIFIADDASTVQNVTVTNGLNSSAVNISCMYAVIDYPGTKSIASFIYHLKKIIIKTKHQIHFSSFNTISAHSSLLCDRLFHFNR